LVGTQHGAEDDTRGHVGWSHVPALDGIRGVAVVAVLLFHGGVSWARGGFLGVDVFFVLSGLLITSLLLDESRRTGAIDLAHFWSRRLRRLLPALLVVVAAAGVYGAVLAPRGSLDGLRKDAVATLFYVANWRYIQAGTNYFEATAAPSVLRHTWSLAVEEQFYLAWPLVMFVVARARQLLAWTAALAGAGTVASAVAMALVFDPGEDTSRAYFGTDTRAQVVLTGAVLAAVVAGVRSRSRSLSGRAAGALGAAAAVSAAAVAAAMALVEGSEPALFRGGFLGLAVAVAVLLAHIVLVPAGWSARALAWGPLRGLGLLSYGLYLWHWPVFLTLTRSRTGLEGPVLLAAKLAVTGMLAGASYVAVERPIRRGAFPRLQATVAATLAFGIAAAAVIAGTEPPPLREPTTVAARTASGFPPSNRPPRAAGQPARVLVVGDSIAKTLADRLARPARRAGIDLINRGVLGCGVVRGGPFHYFGKQLPQPRACESWPQTWAEHVGRHDPDVVLAVVGRWEVMDRVHAGTWTRLGEPAFDAYIERELEEAFTVLSAGDATVAFTTAPYFLRGEHPDGGRWPEDDPARVDRFNAILRGVVERHPNRAALLDLGAQTSRDGQYTPVIDGVDLRFDGVHFSPAGARWLQPWLFGALLEMAPPMVEEAPGPTTIPDPVVPAGGPTTRRPDPTDTTATTPPPPRSTTSRPPEPTTTEAPATTTTAAPATTTTTEPALPGLPGG
jgi:peptidoglycan/LPS O-acetylase OafA/YrhL